VLGLIFALARRGFAQDINHYTLVVTDEVISPACSPRLSLVINGTLPGPELHMNGGDHVHIRYTHWNISNVRVWNQASTENITMHWHGLCILQFPMHLF
jgi:L-ascorbate oxidase